MYIHIYVCTHICIYIHIYVYLFTYIYIYTFTCSEKSRTTQRNFGKNWAKDVPSSSFDVLVRMYFVISTTSDSVPIELCDRGGEVREGGV